MYPQSALVHRNTLKTAGTLLDRFFRDAEGHTNHQLDMDFLLSDLGIPRDRAALAIEYLVSRGLLNSFSPDIAYLTDLGISTVAEDIDIASLSPIEAPMTEPIEKLESASESRAASLLPDGPDDSDLTVQGHIDGLTQDDTTDSSQDDTDSSVAKQTGPHLIHITLSGQTTVDLDARCLIGRSEDNDVRVDDQRASKRHALVRRQDGFFILEDLESANGTLLNGAYCVEPTRLKHDDEIVIGRTMLVFQLPTQPLGATPSQFEDPTSPPESRTASGIRVLRGRPEGGPHRSQPPPTDSHPAAGGKTRRTPSDISELQPTIMEMESTTATLKERVSTLAHVDPAVVELSEILPDSPSTPPSGPIEITSHQAGIAKSTSRATPPPRLSSTPRPRVIRRPSSVQPRPASTTSPPLDDNRRHRLIEDLTRLRVRLTEVMGEGGRGALVVESIDFLLGHPLVQAFVEEDNELNPQD